MKKCLFILFVFVFSFCSKKGKNKLPRLSVPDAEKVVQVNSKEMIQFFDYRFLIGNIDDDFDLNNQKNNSDKNENKLVRRIILDTILPKYNITGIVDTSYTITASGFEYKRISPPKNNFINGLINGLEPTREQVKYSEREFFKYSDKLFKQRKDYVECYPLLILNKSKDTILTRFKFIQEAKDKNGKWKPIECYYNFGGCGNPETYYYKLISNKYIIYPIIKYYGNYKTKIRLKIFNK